MIPPETDALKQISLQSNTNNHRDVSSISSSPFSTSSVFSAAAPSSSNSSPASAKSTEQTWEAELISEARYNAHLQLSAGSDLSVTASLSSNRQYPLQNARQQACEPNATVAPELRQHPRRTHSDCPNGQSVSKQPPSLVRQRDRKDNFVESLVDTTTQMIEVIWPLSVVPCERENICGGRNLIGLRLFIQEVLKRSKTSYSTLQVALYYLVLIKPYIPKVDFTQEQLDDSHASRAMQCGRRMFLAALILASKYLQDRNYSARAWSKISGLKVSEINTNEIAFVKAVDWKLHIPEARFALWTDVVLRFSLSPRSPPSSPLCGSQGNDWRSIVPRLTPELDQLEFTNIRETQLSMSRRPSLEETPTSPSWGAFNNGLAASLKPQAMEPPLRLHKENAPNFPPISPRITQLPTPSLPPANFGTPAASASWQCPGRSMSVAMKQVKKLSMDRSINDPWPNATSPLRSWTGNAIHNGDAFALHRPTGLAKCSINKATTHSRTAATVPPVTRQTSLNRSLSSLISSPESMISDTSSSSSRSSRSSSISSASPAYPLPEMARLTAKATRGRAMMTMRTRSPESMIADTSSNSNRLPSVSATATADLACALRAPDHLDAQASRRCATESQKPRIQEKKSLDDFRHPWDIVYPYPVEEYKYMPRESYLRQDPATREVQIRESTMPAALGTEDIATSYGGISIKQITPQRKQQPIMTTSVGGVSIKTFATQPSRKRERPTSASDRDAHLHQAVREQLNDISNAIPHGWIPSTDFSEFTPRVCLDDDVVVTDSLLADSFLFEKRLATLPPMSRKHHARSSSGSQDGCRKKSRSCVDEMSCERFGQSTLGMQSGLV